VLFSISGRDISRPFYASLIPAALSACAVDLPFQEFYHRFAPTNNKKIPGAILYFFSFLQFIRLNKRGRYRFFL